MGQRRREAELLEGLLGQVAQAVRNRHGKRLEITQVTLEEPKHVQPRVLLC